MTRGVIVALALMSGPGLAYAANWRHPYANIDHRVDAGNDTGDAQVAALNETQLNRGSSARRDGRHDRAVLGLATIYPRAYSAPAYPPPAYYPPPVYPWAAPVYPYPYSY